jgi:hypothetical protein
LFTTIQIFLHKIVRIPTFKVGQIQKTRYAIKQRRRRLQQITIKFESMLKTNKVLFFDSEEFEEIILHYLDMGKAALAKKST